MNWKKHKTACFGLICSLSLAMSGIAPLGVHADESLAQPVLTDTPDDPVPAYVESPDDLGHSNSPADQTTDDTEATPPADQTPSDLSQVPAPPESEEPGLSDDSSQDTTSDEDDSSEQQDGEKKEEPDSSTVEKEESDSSKESTDSSDDDSDKAKEDEKEHEITFRASTGEIDVVAKTTSSIIPEDAVMVVTRIDGTKPAELQMTESVLASQGIAYDGMYAVDIAFMKDGVEIEPENGSVLVSASLHKTVIDAKAQPETLELFHINEQGGLHAEKVASAGQGSIQAGDQIVTSSFNVDSFSIFTFTWSETSGWFNRYTYQMNATVLDENRRPINTSDRPYLILQDGMTFDSTPAGAEISGYEFVRAECDGQVFNRVTISSSTLQLYNKNSRIKRVNGQANQTVTVDVTFIYRKVQSGVAFHANGGNAPAPAFIEAERGTAITLPDYSGTRQGYTFAGWSPGTDLVSLQYYPVFPAGSTYVTEEDRITLYAVWNPQYTSKGLFFVRLDGQIPDEPGDYAASDYTDETDEMSVSNAIQNHYWVIDKAVTTIDDTYYAHNGVSDQLLGFPTVKQVQDALRRHGKTFDPKTQYIHWYVQKWQNNSWHIDGVLLQRNLMTIDYVKNCTDPDVSVPLGYQKLPGTKVEVGADQNGRFIETSRADYEFLGWDTKRDGTGVRYQPHEMITLNENITLYAQWRVRHQGLTITKNVTGNMGDRDKQFPFVLKIFDKDQNPLNTYTFNLKDGQSVSYDVPINGYYEIAESENEGYSTYYSVNGAKEEQSASTGRKRMTDASVNVVFRNHREMAVPTGIASTSNGTFNTFAIFTAIILCAGMIGSKKRREE